VTHCLTVSQPEPGALTLASESAESETARQAEQCRRRSAQGGLTRDRLPDSHCHWQAGSLRRAAGHSDSDGSLKFSGWLLSLPVRSQTEPD
jgi:hypothetical protein